jgi:hypothetical protein
MSPKDTPPEDELPKTEPEPEEPERHKSRKHGYRGYPNNPDVGGGVHSGTGFAGVGSTERGSGGSSVISEKTRESVEELGEEEGEEGK